MKKKNFILVSALCALMSFSFVGCSDDDDPVVSSLPAVSVSNAEFSDDNPAEKQVSGTLVWSAPASVENVTKYVIYTSTDGTTKGTKLGEVNVGTNSFDIAEMEAPSYFLIFAANAVGEATTGHAVKVIDHIVIKPKDYHAFYFLSSGKFRSNNASLYAYDFEKKEIIPDYFKAQNGRGLGDTAQDMIVYGNKMYIAMYGESTIEVTDLFAKSIKQIKMEGQPRGLASDGGKVYISSYDGYVARLDTASLEIDAKEKVGRNPEQLTVSNHKLYVANSGGMDSNTEIGYDKTVSVVDLVTFKEEKKIDVVVNPVSITADEQGYVYVISMGNYGDIPNTFQRIDTKDYSVSTIEGCPNATEMTYGNGKLYMFYFQWGAPAPTYITYDTKAQTVGGSFITDGTEVKQPYKISVAGTKVFLSESDYKNNGDFYGFEESGKLFNKFPVGLNPMKAVLVHTYK